jgi:hypothetical protein
MQNVATEITRRRAAAGHIEGRRRTPRQFEDRNGRVAGSRGAVEQRHTTGSVNRARHSTHTHTQTRARARQRTSTHAREGCASADGGCSSAAGLPSCTRGTQRRDDTTGKQTETETERRRRTKTGRQTDKETDRKSKSLGQQRERAEEEDEEEKRD